MSATIERRTGLETTEYAAMLRRMIRAYGRRLAEGNPHDIAGALELARELDDAIGRAVAIARAEAGWSWAELALELGCTRQAAQQRYGRYCAELDEAGARYAVDLKLEAAEQVSA